VSESKVCPTCESDDPTKRDLFDCPDPWHDGVAQPSERITCTRCGSTDKGVRLALSTYPLIICSDLWHGVAQLSPQPRCDHDPYDICDNCADGLCKVLVRSGEHHECQGDDAPKSERTHD
jgi:hypothetical protein